MDGVAFCPRFRISSFSNSGKHRLGKPFFMKEIAEGPSMIAFRNEFPQLSRMSTRADGKGGGQPPQKHTATSQSSDQKPFNSNKHQKEITDIFKRMQPPISRRHSKGHKMRSPNSSLEKSSAESVESLMDLLRRPKKEEFEGTTVTREGKILSEGWEDLRLPKEQKGPEYPSVKKEIRWDDLLLPKEQKAPKFASAKKEDNTLSKRWEDLLRPKEQKAPEYPSVAGHRLTRPPSNFVKKSPIPSPMSQTKKVGKKIEVCHATAVEEIELQNLEEMKLSDLKNLAKSRGAKGYSKLKKSELVELLRSKER